MVCTTSTPCITPSSMSGTPRNDWYASSPASPKYLKRGWFFTCSTATGRTCSATSPGQTFVQRHAQGADAGAAQAQRRGQHQVGAVRLQKIRRAHVGLKPPGDQSDHVHEGLGRLAALRRQVADLFHGEYVTGSWLAARVNHKNSRIKTPGRAAKNCSSPKIGHAKSVTQRQGCSRRPRRAHKAGSQRGGTDTSLSGLASGGKSSPPPDHLAISLARSLVICGDRSPAHVAGRVEAAFSERFHVIDHETGAWTAQRSIGRAGMRGAELTHRPWIVRDTAPDVAHAVVAGRGGAHAWRRQFGPHADLRAQSSGESQRQD